MEWTGLNELREQFLSFFESKGHTRLPSYPLVPQNDNSLLLINSGMAPMKKFFLGQETPPNKRVTTCQKCIRTPDIEQVGKTSRHGTFFEMLGNFSFGDYFKVEATAWAWEFITQVLKMPTDKLWISIYEDDDEAFDIWTQKVGIPPERIVRLGKEDNFWEHGSGPCGPCSEIYFDRGEEHGCGSPDCKVGCDCDRFMEFWNLVFSQFDSDGNGHYERMDHPNIDTGMGLERLACILQGVDNLFEVDTVQNIMKHISKIAGVTYKEDPKTDVSLRVVTDHIRSTVFMVGDGVLPSNEGRGYVLRRLLRRAARHGRLLGIGKPFLYQVVDTVVQENEKAYPELREKQDYIKKVIRVEEESFAKTIDKGMELLNQLIDKIDRPDFEGGRVLSGEQAFKLYDTFGFPIDLTREIIGERSIQVDEDEFMRLMEQQRTRARQARLKGEQSSWSDDSIAFLPDTPTEFVGYDQLECETKILALIVDGEERQTVNEGETATIVLEKTPFYAESGGQVADNGVIVSGSHRIQVMDCQKTASKHYLHTGTVTAGSFAVGQAVTARADEMIRQAVMRSHSCAHLLQAALRSVLGDHVHQAGQLVEADRFRFDFSHFNPMTNEELAEVELQVNRAILSALPIRVFETDIDSARKMGAMALFGEKYGDIVRVVDMDGYSIELCGGTHLTNTAQVGLFKITSESSAAAGVRRIEAVTGMRVLTLIKDANQTIRHAAEALKVSNAQELVGRCGSLMAELKEKDKEIDRLTQKIADTQLENMFENAQAVNDVPVISAVLNGAKTDGLRAIGDKIREREPKMIAVLASIRDGKGTLLAVCGKEAIAKGAHAGNIVREIAALAGGKGGGRPESAMAGVPEIFKIDEALAQLPSVVQKMVGDN